MKIVNMASVTTPKILESAGKEWVSYGEDNNYFQYLIDRYNGSAVNNAIITGISEQIFGEGLSATDSNRKPLDYAKMRSIFKGEDLKRVAVDYELFGMAAFNIVWNKGKTEILKAKHLPMQNLRPEKAEEGEIKAWFYSDDWTQYRKQKFSPRRIEAFTGARGEETQVMVLKRYASGFFYFSPVDYQGALQWAEIDEEIGNYHLTNIQQGFAPSMLINFNNGKPTDDEERAIERKVQSKLTGTGGKKVLLSFNDSNDTATTIETINISDASEQYKFLSEEATTKIMVGHRVTSPMLFGIKDATGLGNNAEELKTASQLFDNTVIKPKQNIILEAINEVLIINGIILNTFFKTLQPIEFVDTEGLNAEETEKETGVKMCANFSKKEEKEDTLLSNELIALGEEIDESEWELIDDRDAETHEELEAYEFASTGTARPNAKSEQDKTIGGYMFKVRYAYEPQAVSDNSRIFCRKMVSAKKVYRKEDILAMGSKAVNAGWGKGGADTYSIWKYKGGGDCHHKWRRKTFRSLIKIDVKSPLAPTISTNKADKAGYRIRNEKEVAMKPKDMANRGFVNPR
tara:strand:+ start:536 stop:2257 length:1722 start_codon:yes stop_codon:yes gene_type:complete